jgi:hypothetical protein
MLKSENIVIRVSNQKPETMDKISNFVHYLCWSNEHEKLSGAFSKMGAMIESTFPTEDVNTIEDVSKLILVDGLDVQKFIDTRKELVSVKAILTSLNEKGCNKITFSDLNNTDKIFLTLQAHTAVKAIKLDKSILVKDDGTNYDFSPLISKWVESGQGLSNIKKSLSKIFSSIVGNDGELFYSVKVKGGDIPDSDVRQFFGAFTGNAGRSGKDKKGVYTWVTDYSEKRVLNALTDLFAVIFESGNCETIKPEETK